MAASLQQQPMPYREFLDLTDFEWATDAMAGSFIIIVGLVVLIIQIIKHKKTM